jgi:hypothetical protein
MLNLYAIGGVAAAFLAVLSFAGCEHQRAKAAVSRAEALELAKNQAISANASMVDTVEAQSLALQKWANLGQSPDEIRSALGTLTDKQKQLDDLRVENNWLRNKDRALPECVALLKASLSQRCPSIAAGLRKLQGSYQDRHGGDPSPGPEATARRTH